MCEQEGEEKGYGQFEGCHDGIGLENAGPACEYEKSGSEEEVKDGGKETKRFFIVENGFK